MRLPIFVPLHLATTIWAIVAGIRDGTFWDRDSLYDEDGVGISGWGTYQPPPKDPESESEA